MIQNYTLYGLISKLHEQIDHKSFELEGLRRIEKEEYTIRKETSLTGFLNRRIFDYVPVQCVDSHREKQNCCSIALTADYGETQWD